MLITILSIDVCDMSGNYLHLSASEVFNEKNTSSEIYYLALINLVF